MHFANCASLAAVLFTTLIENLKLVLQLRLGLFYILSENEPHILIK